MKEMKIEFTDRYGGNPPSWLRGCFSDCEAMGRYPVFNPNHPNNSELSFDGRATAKELHEWKILHREAGDHKCDGWHFILCPSCHGTGRVSWFVTLGRIPRWIVRGIKFLYQSPTMGKKRTWKDVVLAFKCTFLADLGVWRP